MPVVLTQLENSTLREVQQCNRCCSWCGLNIRGRDDRASWKTSLRTYELFCPRCIAADNLDNPENPLWL